MKPDRGLEVEILFSVCVTLGSTEKFPASKGRCGAKPCGWLAQPLRCRVAAHKARHVCSVLGLAVIAAAQPRRAGKPLGTTVVQQVFGKTSQEAQPVLTKRK